MRNVVAVLAVLVAVGCGMEELWLAEPEHGVVEAMQVAQSSGQDTEILLKVGGGGVFEHYANTACPISGFLGTTTQDVASGGDAKGSDGYIKVRGGGDPDNTTHGVDVLLNRKILDGNFSSKTPNGPFTLATELGTIYDALSVDRVSWDRVYESGATWSRKYDRGMRSYQTPLGVMPLHHSALIRITLINPPATETVVRYSTDEEAQAADEKKATLCAEADPGDCPATKPLSEYVLDGTEDYINLQGTWTYRPGGPNYKDVRVTIINDCVDDGGETFAFQAFIGSSGLSVPVTIWNHDKTPPPPNTYTVFESYPWDGHDGVTPFTVDLRSTRPVRRRHQRGSQTIGGSVTHLRRNVGGEKGLYRATVQPHGAGDVIVTHHNLGISVTIPYGG